MHAGYAIGVVGWKLQDKVDHHGRKVLVVFFKVEISVPLEDVSFQRGSVHPVKGGTYQLVVLPEKAFPSKRSGVGDKHC